jgi:hypothetical protein
MIDVMLREDQGFRLGTSAKKLETVAQRMYLPVGVFERVTPTKKYYSISASWFYCLLHAPLLPLLAIVVRRDESRLLSLFLLITSVSIFVTICALTNQAVYRFVHPFSFVFLLTTGVVLDKLIWTLKSFNAMPVSESYRS